MTLTYHVSLTGHVALVTGAARNLPAVIAVEFAATGAAVAINDVAYQDQAEALAVSIKEKGGQAQGRRYWEPYRFWENGKIKTVAKDAYGPDLFCSHIEGFIERHHGTITVQDLESGSGMRFTVTLPVHSVPD